MRHLTTIIHDILYNSYMNHITEWYKHTPLMSPLHSMMCVQSLHTSQVSEEVWLGYKTDSTGLIVYVCHDLHM